MPQTKPTAPPHVIRAEAAFRPLLLAFLDDTRRDVQTLRIALDKGDAEAVRAKGHSLKGAGGGYGLAAITEYGAAMERAAKDMDMRAADKAVRALAKFLDSVEIIEG